MTKSAVEIKRIIRDYFVLLYTNIIKTIDEEEYL